MNMLREIAALPEILVFEEVSSGPDYDGQVDTFRIRYQSDDCQVEGYIAAPKALQGPVPAIIYNRGGNREFGKLLPEKISRYAAYGYVCLGTQYRGNSGGTGQEEFGGVEVNDAINLISIALKLSFVRKEGVYMTGHSRGGMTTYIACARDPRIKAAAIGAGLADSFIMFGRKREPMAEVYLDLVKATPEEKPEEYVEPYHLRHAYLPCHRVCCSGHLPCAGLAARLHSRLLWWRHRYDYYEGHGHDAGRT